MLQLLPGSKAPAQLLIAAQWTGTGNNQVTNTRETGKGHGMSASGEAEAREFCQAARDKGSFGVLSHIHTIIHTSTNGDDVLYRPTQFNAHDIIHSIDPVA